LDHTKCSTKLECPSLTMDGILHTAKTEPELLDFSKDMIEDRSRADGLSKVLVCTQASYVILQVLGRLGAHLPITLLEVNTTCHVFCAFAMYAFWFNKPLDVKQTISLQPHWGEDLDAIWSMRHRKFEMLRTRDPRSSKITEREVFDHFRVETLYQLFQRRDSYKVAAQAGDQFSMPVQDGITWWCLKCCKRRRPIYPWPHAARDRAQTLLSPEQIVAGPSTQPSPSVSVISLGSSHRPSHEIDVETALLLPHSSSLRTGRDPSPNNMDAGLEIEPDLDKSTMLRQHRSRRSPDDVSNCLTPAHEYESHSSVIGLPDGVELGISAEEQVYFPSVETWKQKLVITREKLDKFVIGTWEQSGFVLIWHSVDTSMSDDFVKSRLARSKMWINVRQVVLVHGYLPNACYFRQKDSYSRAHKLGISHRDFTCQTWRSDTVCAVRLDSSGVRRWELAFEVACEAQARTVFDSKPIPFNEVIMSRFSAKGKALDKETAIGGFNVKSALKCWGSNTANGFLADKISNWPKMIAHLSTTKRWMSRAALALATGLYGCLHAVAWNTDYPSNFERTLWRVSSLIIASSGALATPFFILVILLQRRMGKGAVEQAKDDEADEEGEDGEEWEIDEEGEADEEGGVQVELVYQASQWRFIADWFGFSGGFIISFLGAVGVSYVAARVFIIGEIFASLRMLPAKAYETPDWTNSLPHW
jgi:hypothetical protein